jgi:hypothetical protein
MCLVLRIQIFFQPLVITTYPLKLSSACLDEFFYVLIRCLIFDRASKPGSSRTLADYWASHVIYQLKISSINLMQDNHSRQTLCLSTLDFCKIPVWNIELMNSIFGLFQTGILQATQAVNIKFKLDKKSRSSNSIFETGILQKSSTDR